MTWGKVTNKPDVSNLCPSLSVWMLTGGEGGPECSVPFVISSFSALFFIKLFIWPSKQTNASHLQALKHIITLLTFNVCVFHIAHLKCMTFLVLHHYSLLEIQFLGLNVIKCVFFLHAQRQSSVSVVIFISWRDRINMLLNLHKLPPTTQLEFSAHPGNSHSLGII